MSSVVSPVHPPWYRQPWVWFIIALPLVSVIASTYLVYTAVVNQDDLVRDDWYKAGRVINQDIQADQRAEQRGMGGELVLDPAALAVSVGLAQQDPSLLPARLQLTLVHSTIASEDIITLLERGIDGRWHGSLPRLPMGKRHLTLEPVAGAADDQNHWRLRATDVIFQGEPVALRPEF